MRRLAGVVITAAAGGFAPRAVPQPPPPGEAGQPAAGARGVHDPSTVVKHGGEYWTFTTGRGVPSLRSKDLVTWTAGPPVFAQTPAWVAGAVPAHRGGGLWAPDVVRHGGRYLLYYSASTFGKNTSAIGLASNPTLDPADPAFKWTDHGPVVRSTPADDFNAIDPCVTADPGGRLWLGFGSFWGGIKLVELDPKTGLRLAPAGPVHALAQKEQIEAVFLYRHGGHWYQFVNWGWCCRGVKSTYSIRVGRSQDVTGPYRDKDGVELRQGGGTLLLGTEGRFIGPGHAGVIEDGGRHLLSFHFYDGDRGGRSRLAVRPLSWDADGWPRVAGPPITPAAGD